MSLVSLIGWVIEMLVFDVIKEEMSVLVLMLDVGVCFDIGGLVEMKLGGLIDMGGMSVVGGLFGVECLLSLGDSVKVGGLKGVFGVCVFGERGVRSLGSKYAKAP